MLNDGWAINNALRGKENVMKKNLNLRRETVRNLTLFGVSGGDEYTSGTGSVGCNSGPTNTCLTWRMTCTNTASYPPNCNSSTVAD